jgi:putative endonuclease
MQKGGNVYIITNNHHTTLYIGVTADLPGRIIEHKEKVYPKSFTTRYNLFKLVYYETFHAIEEAIEREKHLKAGSRRKKEKLISAFNPGGGIYLRKLNIGRFFHIIAV